MESKGLKIVAAGLTLAAVVACGKGVGQRNNLNVDGTYERKNTLIATEEGELSKSASNIVVEKIENNIRTTYEFSANKKAAKITRERLMISGNKLAGTEFIESYCREDSEGIKQDGSTLLKKNGVLTMTKAGAQGEEVIVASAISDEAKDLVAKADAGCMLVGCLDDQKRVYDITVLTCAKEETATAMIEDTKSQKIPSADASETSSEESSDSTTTTNEQDLKKETSGGQQLPEGVSEEK